MSKNIYPVDRTELHEKITEMPPKKKNVTLNDIAESLGVSKATVSLAINNDSRVAEETRRKILSKIDELGYVYNRGAAGLSTGQSNTVGLAVHDITNPYFAQVCSECESVLSQNNKTPFLCNTRESLDYQQHFIRTLIEHRADGLILSPVNATDINTLAPIFANNLPTVLIARHVEGAKLDFVGNDGVLSFIKSTSHLIELGHKRIAWLGGGQDTSVSRNRFNGFKKAMETHGLTIDPSYVIHCESSIKGGEEAADYVLGLQTPPTAIVCFSDIVALGVLSHLKRTGLEPGKDVAVVGCDDINESDRGYVQLTTMHIKKGEIGRKAAELLIRRINNPQASTLHIHLESELIVRESCGAYLNNMNTGGQLNRFNNA